MAQKVILDVDTGGDDAVAILLAGHHPAIELVAVTVTHGNGPLERTLDNTLRVLDSGGLEAVPVHAGAARPLLSEPIATDPVQRARLPLPAATIEARPQRAAEFLIDHYLGPDGPDTLFVPLGPQTNMALALRLEPALAERIPRIVTMAGAIAEGNSTPSAEFNVLADPEAAHILFHAGVPITMVGLEVTAKALVSPEDAAEISQLGTDWGGIAGRIIAQEVQWFIDNLGWEGGQIYDACAVAAVIESAVLTTRPMAVDIELQGALTRGRTVADISGYHPGEPNVDVGVDIDRERFLGILRDGLGWAA